MYRPSATRSTVANYVTISIPTDTRRKWLVDLASKLANSDDAIQHAVRIAKENDEGSVSDLAIRDFERSLGLIFGTWNLFLDLNAAEGLADELVAIVHGEKFFAATSKGATMNVSLGENGLVVTTSETK